MKTMLSWNSVRIIGEYRTNVKIINATEGGISIAGVPNHKLVDVLAKYCRQDRGISKRVQLIYEKDRQEVALHQPRFNSFIRHLSNQVSLGITTLEMLIFQLQQLRRLASVRFELEKLQPILNQITSAYDDLLNRQEYDILLKELRESRLSVIKIKVNRAGRITNSQEYDFILQNCLLFFNETKKFLECIAGCIDEDPDEILRRNN